MKNRSEERKGPLSLSRWRPHSIPHRGGSLALSHVFRAAPPRGPSTPETRPPTRIRPRRGASLQLGSRWQALKRPTRPDSKRRAARPSFLPPSAQNSLEIVEMNLRRLPVGRRAERNCCGHVTWDGLRLGRRFRSVTDGLNERGDHRRREGEGRLPASHLLHSCAPRWLRRHRAVAGNGQKAVKQKEQRRDQARTGW